MWKLELIEGLGTGQDYLYMVREPELMLEGEKESGKLSLEVAGEYKNVFTRLKISIIFKSI